MSLNSRTASVTDHSKSRVGERPRRWVAGLKKLKKKGSEMSHLGENTMISCGLSPRVRAIRRASWWLKGMSLTQIKKSLAKDSVIAL